MNVTVTVPARLGNFLDCLKPESRRELYSVGANALRLSVRSHVRGIAPLRHVWATALGGTQTGHLEKGAARITSSSSADHGEVQIPIAGISRAFRDVTITAKRASALTIPVHGAAYGHRVRELERMGWNIFRPKGKDVLMGDHGDGAGAECLYILRRSVTQKQDRTLLPSDGDMNTCVARAMALSIKDSIRKAAS